ncbi:MAG: Gfo/Idh/MocA family oxidoreductase [Verrucomicrobiales bacterium]|nr:Gfo/Idh/MocA family oxidoreductase [Verrucomicrobiales bacterium]
MAEDDQKKEHAIFGSAGMAAAGMIRKGKSRKPRTGKEEPSEESVGADESTAPEPAEAPVEEAVAEDAPFIEFGTEAIHAAEPVADLPEEAAPEPVVAKYLRAAAIGHTGAGNFGHGLDLLFQRLDGVRLVAIADADPSGLDAAQIRTGAETAYGDYREMFEKESLDLVAVGPRETGERYEMVKAALQAGAHVCVERPIARTLREADELVALAKEKGLKLAVLHPMRLDPHVVRFQAERAELIGDLIEMKVYGMMDHRAGGEDLLVLGTHLFDLVRLFGGEPNFCSATITKDGEPVIAEDAHQSEKENIGPVLGDAIHAEFLLDSGVHVSYVSDRRLHLLHGPWGIEFIGTRGKVRLFAGQPPTLSQLIDDDPASPERASHWMRWPEADPYHEPVDHLTGNDAANRIVVQDWLAAIQEDRDPVCSGENALKCLEMVHGVWQAGATMKRAYFPLANRFHPLEES